MPRKAEWENLRDRRCDACGVKYKPFRPEQRFCTTKCRMDFHNHGGAYVKLKPLLEKKIEKHMREMERGMEARIEAAVQTALARVRGAA